MENPCKTCLVLTTCFYTSCDNLGKYLDYLRDLSNSPLPISARVWFHQYEVRPRVLEELTKLNYPECENEKSM